MSEQRLGTVSIGFDVLLNELKQAFEQAKTEAAKLAGEFNTAVSHALSLEMGVKLKGSKAETVDKLKASLNGLKQELGGDQTITFTIAVDADGAISSLKKVAAARKEMLLKDTELLKQALAEEVKATEAAESKKAKARKSGSSSPSVVDTLKGKAQQVQEDFTKEAVAAALAAVNKAGDLMTSKMSGVADTEKRQAALHKMFEEAKRLTAEFDKLEKAGAIDPAGLEPFFNMIRQIDRELSSINNKANEAESKTRIAQNKQAEAAAKAAATQAARKAGTDLLGDTSNRRSIIQDRASEDIAKGGNAVDILKRKLQELRAEKEAVANLPYESPGREKALIESMKAVRQARIDLAKAETNSFKDVERAQKEHWRSEQQGVKASIANYKEWAAERIRQGENVQKVYADLRKAYKEMLATTSVSNMGAQTGIKQALTSSYQAERSTLMQQRASGLFQTGIMGGVTYGVERLFSSAFSDFAEFEKAMRNVNSIAQLTTEQFHELSKSVQNLSRDPRIAASPKELASALYDVYSSGFQGSAALQALEIASKGATAGLTTTKTAVDVLAGTAHAYGMETGPEMQHIMDVLFRTVDKGVITFEQLAHGFGNVGAIASQYNVGIEELGAGIATLTLRGIPAATAMTDLKNLMMKLVNPTNEVAREAHAMGLAWLDPVNAAKHLKSVGLPEALREIMEAAKKSGVELKTLFPDIRAQTAIASLAADGGALFEKQLAYQKDAGGSTNRALDQQVQDMSFQMKKLESALSRLKEAFAETFNFPGVIAALTQFVDLISRAPGWLQVLIGLAVGAVGAFAAWSTGVGMLSMAVASLAAAETEATVATFVLEGALSLLTGPIGLAALALGALVAGVWSYNKQQEINRQAAGADANILERQINQTQELANQYDQLSKKLHDSNTKTEEKKIIEEQLKGIREQLIQLSPDFEKALSKDTDGHASANVAAQAYLRTLKEQLETKRALAGLDTNENINDTRSKALDEVKTARETLETLKGERDEIQENIAKYRKSSDPNVKVNWVATEQTKLDAVNQKIDAAQKKLTEADKKLAEAQSAKAKLVDASTRAADMEMVKQRSLPKAFANFSKMNADAQAEAIRVLKTYPGLTLTSTYRAGDPGHHGKQEAFDVSGSLDLLQRVAKQEGKKAHLRTQYESPVTPEMQQARAQGRTIPGDYGQTGANTHITVGKAGDKAEDPAPYIKPTAFLKEVDASLAKIKYDINQKAAKRLEKFYELLASKYEIKANDSELDVSKMTKVQGEDLEATWKGLKDARDEEAQRNSRRYDRGQGEAARQADKAIQRQIAEFTRRREMGELEADETGTDHAFNLMMDLYKKYPQASDAGKSFIEHALRTEQRTQISNRLQQDMSRVAEAAADDGSGLAGELQRLGEMIYNPEEFTAVLGSSEDGTLRLDKRQSALYTQGLVQRYIKLSTDSQKAAKKLSDKLTLDILKQQADAITNEIDQAEQAYKDQVKAIDKEIEDALKNPTVSEPEKDRIRKSGDALKAIGKQVRDKKQQQTRDAGLEFMAALGVDLAKSRSQFRDYGVLTDRSAQFADEADAEKVQGYTKVEEHLKQGKLNLGQALDAYAAVDEKAANDERFKQIKDNSEKMGYVAEQVGKAFDTVAEKLSDLGDVAGAQSAKNLGAATTALFSLGRALAGDPTALVEVIGMAINKLVSIGTNVTAMARGKMSAEAGWSDILDTVTFGGALTDLLGNLGWINQITGLNEKIKDQIAVGKTAMAADKEKNAVDNLQRMRDAHVITASEMARSEAELAKKRVQDVAAQLQTAEKGSQTEALIKERLMEAIRNSYAKTLNAITTETDTALKKISLGAGTMSDAFDAVIKALREKGDAAFDAGDEGGAQNYYNESRHQTNEKARALDGMTWFAMAKLNKLGLVTTDEVDSATITGARSNYQQALNDYTNPVGGSDPKVLFDNLVTALRDLNKTLSEVYSKSLKFAGDVSKLMSAMPTTFLSDVDKQNRTKDLANLDVAIAAANLNEAKGTGDLEKITAADTALQGTLSKAQQVYYEQWRSSIDRVKGEFVAQQQTDIDSLDQQETVQRRKGQVVTAENLQTRLTAVQQIKLAEARALAAQLEDETLAADKRAELKQQLHKLEIDYMDSEAALRAQYQKQWLDDTNQLADAATQRIKNLYESGAILKSDMDAASTQQWLTEGARLQAVLSYDDTATDTQKMTKEQRLATENRLSGIISQYVQFRGEKYAEAPHVARLAWNAAVAGITADITGYKDISEKTAGDTADIWSKATSNLDQPFKNLPAASQTAFGQMLASARTMLGQLSDSTKTTVNTMIDELSRLQSGINFSATVTGKAYANQKTAAGSSGSQGSTVSYSGGSVTAQGVYSAASQGINLGISGSTVFNTPSGTATAEGLAYAAAHGIKLFANGGPVYRAANGLLVPGGGYGDTVPALLTPGEFVLPTRGTEGLTLLAALRALANQPGRSGGRNLQVVVSGNSFGDRQDIDYLVDKVCSEIGRKVTWDNRFY